MDLRQCRPHLLRRAGEQHARVPPRGWAAGRGVLLRRDSQAARWPASLRWTGRLQHLRSGAPLRCTRTAWPAAHACGRARRSRHRRRADVGAAEPVAGLPRQHRLAGFLGAGFRRTRAQSPLVPALRTLGPVDRPGCATPRHADQPARRRPCAGSARGQCRFTVECGAAALQPASRSRAVAHALGLRCICIADRACHRGAHPPPAAQVPRHRTGTRPAGNAGTRTHQRAGGEQPAAGGGGARQERLPRSHEP